MSELVDHVMELLEPMGEVSARRMFGGHGFFREGVMFALEADDVLYLKVDDVTRPEFDKRDLTPFEYARSGDSITLSYRMAPEEAMSNSTGMCRWAEDAYQAAVRTGTPSRVVNRALVPAEEAEETTPNKAVSDTAQLQAAKVPESANGASKLTEVPRTGVVTPAEVAARLVAERRRVAKGSAKTNGAGKIGKAAGNGKSASDASAGTLASTPARSAPVAAKPARAGGTAAKSRTRAKAAPGTRKSRSAPAARTRAKPAPAEANRASAADMPDSSIGSSLSKTVSRRAAAILTRSMLGLRAAH